MRITGGLGNQMFQYAAGRALAIVRRTPLRLDISFYPTQAERQYQLSCLNIDATILSARQARLVHLYLGRGLRLVRGPINRLCPPLRFRRVCGSSNGYHAPTSPERGSLYLDGYWAGDRYFSHVSDVIRSDFQVRSEPNGLNRDLLGAICGSDAVCVHVRRGDYVTNPVFNSLFGTCGPEYYHAAITEIARRVAEPRFFVFSDDPDWARVNLRSSWALTYVTHNGPDRAAEDLRLMMRCKHFIIANSTFSWWAAWLGSFPGKIVIAPQRWYAETGHSASDIVPSTWVRR